MADNCGCRFQYVSGENERIWLATANSNLRSDLLVASRELELLQDERARLRESLKLAELEIAQIGRAHV